MPTGMGWTGERCFTALGLAVMKKTLLWGLFTSAWYSSRMACWLGAGLAVSQARWFEGASVGAGADRNIPTT